MRFSDECLSDCTDILNIFTSLISDLIGYRSLLFARIGPDERTLTTETLRILTGYQFDRCRSAYCLIVNQMAWDAEIIVRTVYETSAKTVFIGAYHEPKREYLVNEFWNGLAAIYDKRGSDKATRASRLSKSFSSDSERVFDLLSDPHIFNLTPTESRRYRKTIEQRWSFTEIVTRLSEDSDEHITIVGFDALSHMYGMQSHLAHASPKAFDLLQDRDTIENDLLDLENSHIARLLSDMISLGCFSLQLSEFAVLGASQMSDDLKVIFETMNVATGHFQNKFARSQDSFYSNSRYSDDDIYKF